MNNHEKDLEMYLEKKGIKKKPANHIHKEYMGIKIGGIAKPFMRKR